MPLWAQCVSRSTARRSTGRTQVPRAAPCRVVLCRGTGGRGSADILHADPGGYARNGNRAGRGDKRERRTEQRLRICARPRFPARWRHPGIRCTLNNPNCTIIDNGDFLGGLVTNLALFGASGNGGNGTPATSDPLSYLTPPVGTIYPPTTLNSGTTNFAPGIYVISGGNLTINGTATVTGTGVTFYFTNGATISVSGNASLQLTAPTTGPYAGILFFQDPNDTNPPLLGGVGNVLSGVLYFPKAPLTLSGSSSIGAIVAQITHPGWQPDN